MRHASGPAEPRRHAMQFVCAALLDDADHASARVPILGWRKGRNHIHLGDGILHRLDHRRATLRIGATHAVFEKTDCAAALACKVIGIQVPP